MNLTAPSARFAVAAGGAFLVLSGLITGMVIADRSLLVVEISAILLVAGAVFLGGAIGKSLAAALLALTRAARDGRSTTAPSPLPVIEAQAAFEAVADMSRRLSLVDSEARMARAEAMQASAMCAEMLCDTLEVETRVQGQLLADLHDGPAQGMQLALALSQDHGVDEKIVELLREANEGLRGIMAMVSPPHFAESGLAGAIRDLADDLERRYGLRTQVNWPARPVPLPRHYADLIYRLTAESLINVVKHADCDDAEVTLEAGADGAFCLTVRDKGVGFDPKALTGGAAERGHHLGLGLRRTQAAAAGGSLTVTSGVGQGTTVALELPAVAPVPASAPAPARPDVTPTGDGGVSSALHRDSASAGH
ncbi:MAG TPA: ATP-binding protein [Mycobacteriales bacterium]|nr:ATP-binding protein [Mycobacteriales bacterium]